MEATMGTQTDSTEDLTAAINAIWDRYGADMLWAAARRKCGDTFRGELGAREAWARCERSFATLGDRAAHAPHLKLLASTELPVYTDAPPPANDTTCLTCDGTGHLDDGRPCQFCQRDDAESPALVADVEEPTAIEDPGPVFLACEAAINHHWAVQDGRVAGLNSQLDAYDAALARIDAELARVAGRRS
jgi:hypothetical protein